MQIDNPNVIFDTIDNGIILLDEDMTILYWNKWLEIKTEIAKEDILNKNLYEVFSTIKEKNLKRKIKTTLALNSPSYYSVDPHKYLIDIKLHGITNKIYNSMQQSVTIVPYDLEKRLVCLYIYDHTSQSETNYKLNNAIQELDGYKNELEEKVKIEVQKSKDKDTLLSEQRLDNLDMQYKAYHDPLTKIYNRAKIDEKLDYELDIFKRYKNKFCLVIIDIDHFKSFNDTYGHLIGDEMLISLAQTVNKTVRTTDTFARWGGEEFVVLLVNTNIIDARIAVKNIQNAIRTIEHKIAGKITASFGVTEVKENDMKDLIFKRADNALYKAKENGRNRFEIEI